LPTQSNPAWDRLHTSYSHLGEEKLPRVQSAPITDKHPWKATSGPVIGDFVYFTSQCFGQIRGRPAPNVYLVHIHSWPQKRYDPVQRPESQATSSDFLYLEKEELVWRDNRYCVKGDFDLLMNRPQIVSDFNVHPKIAVTPRGPSRAQSKPTDYYFPHILSNGEAYKYTESFTNRYGTGTHDRIKELDSIRVAAPHPVSTPQVSVTEVKQVNVSPCASPPPREVVAAVKLSEEGCLPSSDESPNTAVVDDVEAAEEEEVDDEGDEESDEEDAELQEIEENAKGAVNMLLGWGPSNVRFIGLKGFVRDSVRLQVRLFMIFLIIACLVLQR